MGNIVKVVKGKKALFYQNDITCGYYTIFESMQEHKGIDMYKTKVGLFKNAKICTAGEYIALTKRNPETGKLIAVKKDK